MPSRAATSLLLAALAIACSRTTSMTSPPVDAQPAAPEPRPALPPSTAPTAARPLGPLPPLPTVTGAGRFAMPGRGEAAIEVVLPEKRPAKPALLIAFHGTGEEPENIIAGFELVEKAAALGIVVIAPRAGHRDTPHPADVDHPINWGGSSWNMWTAGADANEDLRYVRALIEAAQKTWGVDTTRVYTAGFSNGAYFSYFVAASMPDRIAGFAAMAGGWTTDACPSRTDQDGASLHLLKTTAPAGREVTCSALAADRSFPAKCRPTAANKLHAPQPGARVPFGYLSHYTLDDSVSVVWSCLVAEALGARAKTKIHAREPDGTTGHTIMPGFIDGAFQFFAGRTTAQ